MLSTMKGIEDVHAEAFRKLSAQPAHLVAFSERMLRGDGAERVRMVYDLLERYDLLPGNVNGASEGGKSENAAKEHRERGNLCFKLKDYKEARKSYTKAISSAPSGSKELFLAYGNRSAAIYYLEYYKTCQIDADRALELIVDDEPLRKKLIDRKKSCLDKEDPPQPPHPRSIPDNPLFGLHTKSVTIPCSSQLLTTKHDAQFGRYITAVKDIDIGTVLAIEDPYITCLLPEQFYDRCFECCQPTKSPIPCPNCIYANFCSDICKRRSASGPHKYECPIMEYLIGMDFTKLELLALRTVIQARIDHDSWESLRRTVDTVESAAPINKGYVNTVHDEVYDSDYYASVHSLETNEKSRDASDYFLRAVSGAVFLNLLKKTQFYDDSTEDDVWFSGKLLLHHYMTSASNMHSLGGLVQKKGNFLAEEEFASGAFPFLSLINHSCAPNVHRVCVGTSVALLALAPIKRKEQLFDNYGQHHALHDYVSRQRYLMNQYKFICKCRACIEQWPMYIHLNDDSVPSTAHSYKFDINERVIGKLEMGDRKFVMSILSKLYKSAKLLQKYAPSKTLAGHHETIKQCWALFGEITYEI